MPAVRCVAGVGADNAAGTMVVAVLCTAVPTPQPLRLTMIAAAGVEKIRLFKSKVACSLLLHSREGMI
jgi:hypothetical protein